MLLVSPPAAPPIYMCTYQLFCCFSLGGTTREEELATAQLAGDAEELAGRICVCLFGVFRQTTSALA